MTLQLKNSEINNMIDINKILEIVDSGKEVFLAREDKPMVVVLDIGRYEKLKESNSVVKNESLSSVLLNNNEINSNKIENDDYSMRVKRSLVE